VTDTGWRVEIAPAACRDIKRLDKHVQARILTALQGLHAEPARGDITRLTGITPPEWRLRVGDWRVRFNRDHDRRTILILRVLPRLPRLTAPAGTLPS
jgi:mRNA interferase RelE/StbE